MKSVMMRSYCFFWGGGNTTMTDVLRRRGEDTQRQRGDTGKEVV